MSFCRKEGVDFLLAVGGGSVIDSAKAIGYGLANDGDVWDFYEHTRQASACLPIGVVLTIAASGSEMSNSSVITNDEKLEKRGYNNAPNICWRLRRLIVGVLYCEGEFICAKATNVAPTVYI